MKFTGCKVCNTFPDVDPEKLFGVCGLLNS